MPAAPLMADIGLSKPLTAAQRPFILWVGGRDIIPYVDKTSYRLDDKDLTQPGMFTITITDTANTVGPFIHRLDEVMWYETLTTNGTGRILFRGFVRQIDVDIVANYALWTLTCADLSEILDYSIPIITENRGKELTSARVKAFLGLYSAASGATSFISTLSGVTQPISSYGRETARTAIEKAIALEADATHQPNYYLDYYYNFHLFYGFGDVAAPYALTDQAPDHVTTVNYSAMRVTYDSTTDVDVDYVYGANAKASGYAHANVPRYPTRYTTIDSTASTTKDAAIGAGQGDLSRRQNVLRVSVVVTGYDGWAKGQSVNLTNAVLGFSAVGFWVAGVSMRVLSGTGYREYTLQLNASKPRMSRIASLLSAFDKRPVNGIALQGEIGGTPSF